MKINISKTHIDEAVRANSHHCMIRDAIAEQVEGASRILVDAQSIRFSDPIKGLRYFFYTPPEAQAALLRFDAGDEVKPFSFTLPEPIIQPRGWKAIKGRVRRVKKPANVVTGRRRKQAKRMSIERKFGLRYFEENKTGEKHA